jgi:outer membrane protein assembly factor BamB
MKSQALMLFALVSAVPAIAQESSAPAEGWPQFRGPNADGHYKGPKLPTEWGTDKNVAWKKTIPGHGWSSPIVWKGKVYLTTAVEKKGSFSLRTLCIDAKDGRIDWDKEVFVEDAKAVPKPHPKNSHASPTPVTDGERLYVHFGHMGTAALDLKGKIIWAKTDLKYSPVHGNGGSPILAGDNLVFSVDGGDKQMVVARSKKTGIIAWRTDRKSKSTQPFSFSTPLLVKDGGRQQIISPASGFVASYDPKSGAELWRAQYPVPGYSVIPQPLYGNGLVYVSTSYNNPVMLALKPTGKGDVTKTNTSWSLKQGAPHTPTPILVGDELYMLADNGNLTCVDAKTGTVHWSERVKGAYSSSPIAADGKIYLTNEDGTGYVLEAGKELKEISKNDLKEKTFATFAAVDGALYVRTETQLYKFEQK